MLGAGGMGAVYLAENLAIRRQVAIKVLHARMGRDPATLHRFRQEARATATIGHPGVVDALGQAFFTLSVGMGAVMTYGAYLPQNESIQRSSFLVVIMDTSVALLAGLVIFPIVFANGLDPASGPGLVFQSLPLAFGQMPGGAFVAVLFFVLLTFAAWTSAISLMEPAVAYFMETRGLGRSQAALLVGGCVALLTEMSHIQTLPAPALSPDWIDRGESRPAT